MTAPGAGVAPGSSSDAPQSRPGVRTRSGNAMQRTRAAILQAAAGCVERQGVKRTTMGDVAQAGPVAKATLYNHFRTKDDVLRALVDARVAALGEACAATATADGLAAALAAAAAGLSADPALRAVAAGEPALLVPLLVPGGSRGWEAARAAVVAVLTAAGAPAGPDAVDVVLRWLVGQLLWPATEVQAGVGAAVLAAGLAGAGQAGGAAAAPPASQQVPHPANDQVPAAAAAVTPVPAARGGLGWPSS